MAFNKPDETYWNNKTIAYFHDPLDKAFKITGHEERGRQILEIMGLQKPNEEFWRKADGIASGFERGQVPSFNNDYNKNGAVDFTLLTHPTATKTLLEFDFSSVQQTRIFNELQEYLQSTIGAKVGEGGFTNKPEFKNNPQKMAYARFLYSHLALRFELAENNVGNIGALWHRLPADTRFPDHTIWQHNAFVSGINSCIDERGKKDLGMMVFSITPVQAYISRARKLRDYWTGSVILSWLAFEGIRWVMENLGPDHILYPSLIDQPLVNQYLKSQGLNDVNSLNTEKSIASFPNKFMFLVPYEDSEEIGAAIQDAVFDKWRSLGSSVFSEIEKIVTDESKDYLRGMFERQFDDFWDMSWAAVKMLEKDSKSTVKELLPEIKYKDNYDLLEIFNEIIKDKQYYEKSGVGVLYSVSHSLLQTALAAQKTAKVVKRNPEPGEKCQLCGEFEALNTFLDKNKTANAYSKNIKSFWDKLSKKFGDNEIKESEHLCAICLTKRLASSVIKKDKDHILYSTFKDAESFPSTTYMSLYDDKDFAKMSYKEKREYADSIHNKEDIQVDNRHRYYAILMMDGDKMGDLVSGTNIGSTWESIMHPEMTKRLKEKNFDEKYQKNWAKIYKDYPKRLLTPSIHASISESLGDFAVYGVAGIINKYDGRLIYAGGDDVCAILPVSNALFAADEIRKYYNSNFKLIRKSNINSSKIEIVDATASDVLTSKGKLSVNLGRDSEAKISISAGVLICHHKDNLSGMIEESHKVLDKAKKEGGRDAIAVELRKRSGGSRFFVSKWNDKFETFASIGSKISGENIQEISRSLVYRLSSFQDGVDAMLQQDNRAELLTKFVAKQLGRSGLNVNDAEDENKREKLVNVAKEIVQISLTTDSTGKFQFKPEALIIAAFIADKKNTENGGE